MPSLGTAKLSLASETSCSDERHTLAKEIEIARNSVKQTSFVKLKIFKASESDFWIYSVPGTERESSVAVEDSEWVSE